MDFHSIAIGPLNQCGQAYAWAEAVKRFLGAPAVSFASNGPVARRAPGAALQDEAHVSIPHRRLAPHWYRSARIKSLAGTADRLIVESFADVGGLSFDAVVMHGSDLRDPDAHMARMEYSLYETASSEWVELFRQSSAANRLRAGDHVVFVSTPDLLLDAPAATWLPLTVELEDWRMPAADFSRERPVVLHLPSRRNPPIKGSQFINPVLEKLDRQGKIRCLRPDMVKHREVRSLVERADIVVDQILTGSYGVAAVEAMAAGRVVVGNVSSEVRALVGDEVPIVDASPASMEATIVRVIEDPSQATEVARRGVDYVTKWHSGEAAAEALRSFVAPST